jgi:hypothetical protein
LDAVAVALAEGLAVTPSDLGSVRESAVAVIARFYRYAAVHEEEFDTVDEAARFLAYGEDAGTLASDEIREGDRVIRDAELDRVVEAAWRTIQ